MVTAISVGELRAKSHQKLISIAPTTAMRVTYEEPSFLEW